MIDPCWASSIREEDEENMPPPEEAECGEGAEGENDGEEECAEADGDGGEEDDALSAVINVLSHELMDVQIDLMQLLVFRYLPFYDTQTRCAEAGACA